MVCFGNMFGEVYVFMSRKLTSSIYKWDKDWAWTQKHVGPGLGIWWMETSWSSLLGFIFKDSPCINCTIANLPTFQSSLAS